ncbi:MAG TPA: glycosyltransferase [Longimicrobiales bacterium]|nr:glycosyltransferase [Longimicrobiales bacterium]
MMLTVSPKVSVVIPTHNRLPILLQCLEAVAAQSVPAEWLEVIVVADGCTDGTADALRGRRFPFELRVIEQPASGAAAARNRGATEARGELLLFLDDDVIPSTELVSAHLEAHQRAHECVVVGPYLPDPPGRGDYLAEGLWRYWEKTFAGMDAPGRSARYTDLLSGNLSIPTHTFARLGGFDPAFPECGLEDYELGIRVLREGIPIGFAARARARHLETTDLMRSFKRKWREGNSTLLLVERHPSVLPDTRLVANDRWTRFLVFRTPRLGAWLANRGIELLRLAQRLGLRRYWFSLHQRLKAYSFWCGVKDGVGTEAELERRIARMKSAADAARNPQIGVV